MNEDTETANFDEVVIIPGSTGCLGGTHPVALRNISGRVINVTYSKTSISPGFPAEVETIVINSMAPGQIVEMGCEGCGTFSGIQRCVHYQVVAVF